MRILSHRASLHGPDAAAENTLSALDAASGAGFDVEFDVRPDADGRLVLSHDPQPWSAERDACTFLEGARPAVTHALNVKDLDTLDDLLAAIARFGAHDRFTLFDFELLGGSCELLADVQRRGFGVAHRVSDREPYADDYAGDPAVHTIWLDELDGPWVDEAVVRLLRGAGKEVLYVSPDLHGCRDAGELASRWRDLADWGASAICTDYPVMLRDLLEGTR